MQLADEDRSDAVTVQRDQRLRDRRERADASVRSTGLGEYCKSIQRGMRWVFIILTSRSFFLGESSNRDLGTIRLCLGFFLVTTQERYGFESE